MDVFKYKDYRELINAWIQSEQRSGTRTRLSRAAGCSPAWMSRTLSGSAQLTPDQALGVCEYFRFNEKEADYFLLLVDYERASTLALKKRILSKLKQFEKESRQFSASVKTDSNLADEDYARYYSTWIYAAIHVATMIQDVSLEDIAKLLRVSEEKILDVLSDLKKMGLVINQASQWRATSKNIHLPAEHPMANIGHVIWRNYTIRSLQEHTAKGLHYSAIHCLSKKDRDRLREKLKETVLGFRKAIEDSPSESLAVFCLDWMELD